MNNFLRTASQSFARSPHKNRLVKLFHPTPPYFGVKIIYAKVSCKVTDLQSFISQINANVDDIMALLLFNSPVGAPYYSASSSGFVYDFDAHPSFSIGNGTIIINQFAWQWIGQDLFSWLKADPWIGNGLTPGDGYDVTHPDSDNGYRVYEIKPDPNTQGGSKLPYPIKQSDILGIYTTYNAWIGRPPYVGNFYLGGFTSPQKLIAFNESIIIPHRLQWFWAYYPNAPVGTASPLYSRFTNHNTDESGPSISTIDNLTSVKPDTDLYTPTTGSVFKLPNPNFAGYYTTNNKVSLPLINIYPVVRWDQKFYMKDSDFITPSTGAGGTGDMLGSTGAGGEGNGAGG